MIAAIERMVGAESARLRKPAAAKRAVVVGIGDDAAVLRTTTRTLVTTDAMVQGVHFEADWLSPAALGRRAFRAAVSDVAAMGGRASAFTVALALPEAYAEGLAVMRGAVRDAAEAGVALAGGNITRARELSITCTVFGDAPIKQRLRSHAKAGHSVFVTGTLGDVAAGVEALRGGLRKGVLVRAYQTPPLRLEAGRRFARISAVGAMIDVSDGFAQDLGHVCRASGLSARIDTALLPVSRALRTATTDPYRYALAGGEDYELIVTAPHSAAGPLQRAAAAAGCTLTRVGDMVAEPGRAGVTDDNGQELTGGFTHF